MLIFFKNIVPGGLEPGGGGGPGFFAPGGAGGPPWWAGGPGGDGGPPWEEGGPGGLHLNFKIENNSFKIIYYIMHLIITNLLNSFYC